ncbi:hypothetical protein CC80DRAFT_546443 [Byssothecium circinans]|uniref:Ankyrin n=1 Tax=Byssothecium circinans TaxID=147558 RepID=A0A6A5TZ99_9PLEO|nr:hypothetical protein CC80DRAFT_546443 [Byssothecium circinans]
MLLLDSCPEIFQKITHELVSDIGVAKAWKLRSVCRTFAAEIDYDICANQLTKVVFYYIAHRILKHRIGRYIHNRIKAVREPSTPLLQKIKDMSEYLVEELELQSRKDRDECTASMCEGLQEAMSVSDFYYHSKNGDQTPQSSYNPFEAPLKLHEKLTAAMALGNIDLVCRLIPHLHSNFPISKFRSPLSIAVSQGYEAIVSLLVLSPQYRRFE